MDYLAPESNSLCYALAVEKLLGITDSIPERAQVIRVLIAELTRIASHCVWLGTHGIDLGAISIFFYLFDLRENILDLQEAAGGARMHPNYVRIGGLNGDLPDGYLAKLDALIAKFPRRMRDLRGLLQANPIFQDRTIDVGISLARRGDRLERHRTDACAAAASPTTFARPFRTAVTRRTSSTYRRAPKATRTRASWCVSTRWTSRCASSSRCASVSTRPAR